MSLRLSMVLAVRERIKGTATYDRFRRFSVATDETVKKPPPQ